MANTPSYINPATGATPPTAAQARLHQTITADVTGDNAATSIVITHNWNLSTADQNAGLPNFRLEPLLAAFYGANPFLSAHDANSVTFTNVAFTGKAVRIVLERFKMLT